MCRYDERMLLRERLNRIGEKHRWNGGWPWDDAKRESRRVGTARSALGSRKRCAGSVGGPAGLGTAAERLFSANSHYREAHFGARRKRTRRSIPHSAALCRRTSPLALVLGRAHLCVRGQLDTRDYRVQFLFPILRVWAHPSSTLPVSTRLRRSNVTWVSVNEVLRA